MSSPELDFAVAEARQKMPMDSLFVHYGLGEFVDHDQRKRQTCPWCGRLGTFGPHYLKDKKVWTFRCFGSGCEASKEVRQHGGDEIGFVCLKEGLPGRKEGMFKFFEIAGVTLPAKDDKLNIKPKRKPARPAKSAPTTGDATGTMFHVEHSTEQTGPIGPDSPVEHSEDGGNVITGDFSGADEEESTAGDDSYPPDDAPPTGPPPPNPAKKQGEAPSVPPWERFLSMLILTSKDREKLKTERGLTDAIIDKFKIRSNTRYNDAAIQTMREEYPMRVLLGMGLFKIGKTGTPIPQRQFSGWGPVKAEKEPLKPKMEDVEATEKENTDDEDEEKEAFAQMERPLIPYLDRFGRCFTIRPHKGNIAKTDKLDDDTCGGRVYCPLLLAELIEANDYVLVITEGEWKALALCQCGIAAISLPGTGFVRNHIFREELIKLLCEFKVREVIIVFDNENRDTFGSPYYRQDPWTRYDTSVYAKYIAWDLMRKTPTPPTLKQVRIGWLPNEWRNDLAGRDSGKIDWDTALANHVARASSHASGIQAATLAFRKVLEDAVLPAKFVEHFLPEEAPAIVGKKLGDLWHDPLLTAGGRAERKLASRLDQLNGQSPAELVSQARNLSRAFRSVIGTYYERKHPNEKKLALLLKAKKDVNEQIEAAEKRTDAAADKEITRLKLERKLLTELIAGVPEALGNFTMKCEFCLHSTDGTTHRMIQFRDHHGRKTGLIKVDGAALAGLHDFRVFCLQKTEGIASWRGGEKQLQKVVEDMIHSSAERDIYEVESYGYHEKTRMWFFGDCAYSPTGQTIMPDDTGVCWWQGQGYRVDAHSQQRDVGFEQGDPLLQAGKYSDIKIDPKAYANPDPMHYLVSELENCLISTVGDMDSLLCLGVFFSYFVGPEIFAKYRAQPGLWLYGRKGGGKTTIARWLMRLHGFAELNGTRITKDTTPVAMTRNLSQNCFLSFWFDEFRTDIEDIARKESVLRGAFDRSGSSKGIADDSNKTRSVKAKTTPLVAGESSSSDGATRSRYIHVLVAKSRREKHNEVQRMEHLEALSRHFHLIGRYLMENRPEFAALSMELLDRWMNSPEIRASIPDQRTRIVHGPAMACIGALNSMLNIWPNALSHWKEAEGGGWNPLPGTPAAQLAEFTIKHSQQAFADVEDDTMVNKWWQTVAIAVQRGEIPRSNFVIGDFYIDEAGRVKEERDAALSGKQAKLRKYMVFASKAVFDAYAEYVRRTTGLPPSLSYKDIQREICREPFFVPPPGGKERCHRAYIGQQRQVCWVIDMTLFPHAADYIDAITEPGSANRPMFGGEQ